MWKIKLYCLCNKCEGIGKNVTDNLDGILLSDDKPCPNCENGKTVMVFEWNESIEIWLEIGAEYPYSVNILKNGEIEIYDSTGDNEVTESLNILYYEKVEEQECPECKGDGRTLKEGKDSIHAWAIGKCPNCSSGKIEVVTFTGFFGSKKEHDDEAYYRGFKQGLVEKELKGSE